MLSASNIRILIVFPKPVICVDNGISLAFKAFEAGNYNRIYHHKGKKT